MRTRRPSAEHQEAVSRRLALLSAELATVRPTAEPESSDWAAGHTRIRVAPAAPSLVPEARSEPAPVELAPLVPRPGRHASRRPGRGLAGVLPESVRGRIALGPTQVTIVAVLVTLGLAPGMWRASASALPLRRPAPRLIH